MKHPLSSDNKLLNCYEESLNVVQALFNFRMIVNNLLRGNISIQIFFPTKSQDPA